MRRRASMIYYARPPKEAEKSSTSSPATFLSPSPVASCKPRLLRHICLRPFLSCLPSLTCIFPLLMRTGWLVLPPQMFLVLSTRRTVRRFVLIASSGTEPSYHLEAPSANISYSPIFPALPNLFPTRPSGQCSSSFPVPWLR